MTVIVIQARAGRQLLADDPLAAAEAADVIRAVAAEAESDIGALVELMNPDRVVPLTGQVLDELVARAAATGTAVTVTISGDVDDLDPAVAATAHRVVQETLTNALRHAPGAAVRITLDCRQVVGIKVTNEAPTTAAVAVTSAGRRPEPDVDGRRLPDQGAGSAGLPLNLTGAGRGLQGMKERVTAAGGLLCWGPSPAGGWSVTTILPRAEPGTGQVPG